MDKLRKALDELNIKYDDEITVTVEGTDEPLAMEAMEKFIKENL